jgi:23S rRNA (uracil1939-C5)-methyltransferase
MALGEIVLLTIESIVSGGAGLARPGGRSVFVEGTAPGETVRCRVVEEHGSWARAELLDIAEASRDRVEPACAYYGRCGGCNLQHLRYEAQLGVKQGILLESFARIGGLRPPAPLALPSAAFEYRNRMEFHRYGGAGFGLKARRGAEIIPIADCPAADPGIRRVLGDSRAGKKVLSLPPEKNRFTVYARQGLLLNEGGKERGAVRLLDRDIILDAGVFFQSNGAMLEMLIGDLREIVKTRFPAGSPLPMADIFCGVGTFAAFLGDSFSRLDLVEENKTALALARENLRHRGKGETVFFAGRDDKWARAQNKRTWDYGFVSADPPRQGMSRALARSLAAHGPPVLAYISCDPAALARDSGILTAAGYTLAELRLYDFYPQTSHIESLAVFNKNTV